MRPKIVIAYDATPAAADGLALGALLADLRGADMIVARVLPHTPSGEATERALQASFRATLQETREAAAELLGDRPFELWPVFGESVAEGIDDLAGDQGAELIVFGSPHHGAVGRALLGQRRRGRLRGRALRGRRRPALLPLPRRARDAGGRRRLRRLGRVRGGGRGRRPARARRGRHAAADRRRAGRLEPADPAPRAGRARRSSCSPPRSTAASRSRRACSRATRSTRSAARPRSSACSSAAPAPAARWRA